MKKAWVVLALFPLSAQAERQDLSEFIGAKARQHFRLEVDTEEKGFYVKGEHGESFVPFSQTKLFHTPPQGMDYDSAFERYTREGGRFAIRTTEGIPDMIAPNVPVLGGGDGAPGCARVEKDCNKDANERYDRAIERCKSEIDDKDRSDCKAEASRERDTDKSDCRQNTDRCYDRSERESRSDGSNFGSSIGAGERMMDSLSDKFSNWWNGK
ncbi:MAG: hypothetical protein OXT67_00665 [Zetaproteobacteria bacterium]|nr:hypothetical protein [Zetaproteobacteria bacterium]